MNIARYFCCFQPPQAQPNLTPGEPPAGTMQDNGFSQLDDALLSEIFNHLDLPARKNFGLANKALQELFRFREKNLTLTGSNLAAALNRYPNVEQIRITGALRPEDVANISTVMEKITWLDLRDCNELTDAAIIALANKCPNLTSLNLSWRTQLTDAAITALANKCTKLTSLNLMLCYRLTDAAITALPNKCPNLTSLNLADCTLLTDAAITALANQCHNLSSLDLTRCHQITDAAILALANQCHNLTSLNLTDCYQLTDAAIQTIQAQRPMLRIFR